MPLIINSPVVAGCRTPGRSNRLKLSLTNLSFQMPLAAHLQFCSLVTDWLVFAALCSWYQASQWLQLFVMCLVAAA